VWQIKQKESAAHGNCKNELLNTEWQNGNVLCERMQQRQKETVLQRFTIPANKRNIVL